MYDVCAVREIVARVGRCAVYVVLMKRDNAWRVSTMMQAMRHGCNAANSGAGLSWHIVYCAAARRVVHVVQRVWRCGTDAARYAEAVMQRRRVSTRWLTPRRADAIMQLVVQF